MSNLFDYDVNPIQQQTLDNMTDNIFANEWMPSWEEKSAAATTYNHYSPTRKVSDDEMFEFCMSGIANVEDFIRSKPNMEVTFDTDAAAGDQDAATYAVDTEADDVFAAITTYNDGAVYDDLAVVDDASTSKQDAAAITVDNEAEDVIAATTSTNDGAVYHDLAVVDAATQQTTTAPRYPASDHANEVDVPFMAATLPDGPAAVARIRNYLAAQKAEKAANSPTTVVDATGHLGGFNAVYGEWEYKDIVPVANAAATNTPAQGFNAAITEPTVNTVDDATSTPVASSTGVDAHYGYAYAAAADPFASDFNPLLDDVFASMTPETNHGPVGNVAVPSTVSTIATTEEDITATNASSESVADNAATNIEPIISPQASIAPENGPQAAQFGDDDLFGGLGDFPDFPEFDDVVASPVKSTSDSHDAISVATGEVQRETTATNTSSTHNSDGETYVSAADNTSSYPAVDDTTAQDYKLVASSTPLGSSTVDAFNIIASDTVGSTSTTSTATSTSPQTSATSNTSPASNKSATFSNKYVSPFVSDEDDLFPPMESFEDFTSSHSSPSINGAATPSAKVATQDVVDLTADTPVTASFPAMGPAYYQTSMPTQPAYSSPMPTQSAYTRAVTAQPAYAPPMPTQQYQSASPYLNPAAAAPYLNAAPFTPHQPQKPIYEMSDTEIAAWLASADVAPIPGLESPHYASTELPTAPYTSPMPRKRKASTTMLPAQQPKKARVDSSRPIAQPKSRGSANGIPANYSWLSTPAAPTRPVAAPPSAMGSDPAPLLAFTIGGKVQGCTRVSDEQWAKMYDSAVVNGGMVRIRGGRWARLVVTGREKVVEGVRRGVVAVVLE